MNVLRRAGRTESLGQGRWIRDGVVVAEVALSFVLLVGSGLMLRSFGALYQASPGFDAKGVLTFQLANINQATQGPEGRLALVRDLKARLEAVPGVVAVTATSYLPLGGDQEPLTRYGKEDALADPTKYQQGNIAFIQPGYFEAMDTPVLEGRAFVDEDNRPTPPGILIDTVLAAKMFPGGQAVGQRLFVRILRNEPDPYEVIGVVGHQRYLSPALDSRETLYLPDAFIGGGAVNRWVVRTTGDPAVLEAGVRRTVTALDPRLGVFEVKTMDGLVDEAAAGTKFVLWLLSLFAGVAIVMAGVGLYSVLSTAVRQRTAEIGVRMAFGASGRSIFTLIVGQGLKLSVIGIVIGLLGARLSSNALSGSLVGVSATDPLTYGVMAAGFLAVSLIACGVPALRASRLAPIQALHRD
jgi:putative ABC transport system permease protein